METRTQAATVRHDMRHEARRIIDAAREHGMVLRLLGGLAVREHCTALEFCERDHADLDMIGLRDIITLLKDVPMADHDAPDVVNPQSIALLCA